MSNERRSYSEEERDLISLGMARGWPLTAILGSADFQAATKKHQAFIKKERETFTAEHYLAFGNDGAFKDTREREAAFSHPLYASSDEYRKAVAHKASQTPDSIMGIHVPEDPMSAANMLRAAQLDSFNAIKADLFDKANSSDKVVATSARLKIIELGNDPATKALIDTFDPGPEITRPYETWLKSQPGGVQFQTFPSGTEAEQQQEAARRNLESHNARPGGKGDAGAEGEATVTLR